MLLHSFRVRSHERRNELILVWDFKPAWKQVLFPWSFISAAFQNDLIFWWTTCRHFISGSVCIIFYHPKWNFISVKMTDMKSISALSFTRTCALNATSNESALIHFVSGGCLSDIASSHIISVKVKSRSMLHHGSVVASLKKNKRNLTQTLTLNVLLLSIVFLNKT